MTTKEVEKPEIIHGSLSEVINKLLIKSVGDKSYFDLIIVILHVIRDSGTMFRDFKISIEKIGSEFTVLFEYEQNLYVAFNYEENTEPGIVPWQFLDAELIKPFLNNQLD